MQRRASFSSSPVPTEIQIGSWNPTFQKTKGGPPAQVGANIHLEGSSLTFNRAAMDTARSEMIVRPAISSSS